MAESDFKLCYISLQQFKSNIHKEKTICP